MAVCFPFSSTPIAMTYQLTAEDLDIFHEDDSPTIRTARNPNPALLKALLARYAERAGSPQTAFYSSATA
ncbi:hypothetical protein BBP40_008768 [Aspergillus hancockii]|nr:hypothetical protein BBP40_008768 [Aspergillus hancockii]